MQLWDRGQDPIISQQMCQVQGPGREPLSLGQGQLFHTHRFFRKDRGLDHVPKGEAQLTACTEAASFSMKGDRL